MTEINDQFRYRNEGGRFDVGTDEDGTVSAMVKVGDDFLIVKTKSIYSMILPDSIDPERTNPTLPKHSQQKVLSYGSEEPFVGRTLLQADVLFKDHAQPSRINSASALNISLSFLKEIAVLHELSNKFTEEFKSKNASFEGKTDENQSLHLPSISDIDQQTKTFIRNSDNAARHIIELAQLFYPDIKNKGWGEQLLEKLKAEKGSEDPSVKFVEIMNPKLGLVRNLRNAIEHPQKDDKVEIQDYRLDKTGYVTPPTILYAHKEIPLAPTPISIFMQNTLEDIQISFEVLMAHLCNIHAEPFAGDVRSVIQITTPRTNCSPSDTHVRFEYQIHWTK
jgi:hypothetical protein